jgi:hypothetical protein
MLYQFRLANGLDSKSGSTAESVGKSSGKVASTAALEREHLLE